ncbi:ectonucleotide pyrophosphatase/phosphodiesterase family member 6-like [Centruroides sculpturatus]|uniref:ectonucleotide pyrophosphatase/phosphodiesterase family member 6-like n=1 Tax=Centruroides sculpturatus TaxID=218467 RepID=UPI000C6EA493|nr:ectonucleotide pyrophosphatase/phosphodiesterase family member 6-like [Centruroides sculpturatus]
MYSEEHQKMLQFVILALSCIFVNGDHHNKSSKVILIHIDGCRWDYVNDSSLKGFAKLAKFGVKAEYVKPVFPSNTYPNSYSIATGLYPESHGFVQNIMYDAEREEFFLMLYNPNSTNSHWWESAEPIWVTAEKRGIKTALYWWPGSDVEIHGILPTFFLPHRYTAGGENVTKDIQGKLEHVLNMFHRDEIRLAMVYYGAVDNNGHHKGPDAPETRNALKEMDKILDHLQGQISQRGLANQVSIVIVSDHGMTNTGPEYVDEISLEPFADDIKYSLYKGSSTMIQPVEGKLDKLYNDLKQANIKGLQIFKKEEIPEKYHFKHNKYVLPLFLLADKGYFIKALSDFNKTRTKSEPIIYGYHGYDPNVVEDMRTIFFARGPGLKKNYLSPPIENVDHYNLVCKLLQMAPLKNNGSWDRVKDMLGELPNSGSTIKPLFLLGIIWVVKFIFFI